MACWIPVTVIGVALAGSVEKPERAAVNRDYLSLMLPIRPSRDAVNAGARTTITTTRGASFSVAETTDAILSAPCGRERRTPD